VFFGRADEVGQLAGLLQSPAERAEGAALLVVGPSGCGKSSLVRAGLLLVRQHTVEVRATAHAARGLACTSQPTKAHSMALGCGSAQHHPDLVEFRDSRDVL